MNDELDAATNAPTNVITVYRMAFKNGRWGYIGAYYVGNGVTQHFVIQCDAPATEWEVYQRVWIFENKKLCGVYWGSHFDVIEEFEKLGQELVYNEDSLCMSWSDDNILSFLYEVG